MRGVTDRAKLERFMSALGDRVKSNGTIYLTGGATAVLFGWRDTTIDVDIKADPEPAGLFEAIAALKDELDVNTLSDLQKSFDAIEEHIIRYPGIEQRAFKTAVQAFISSEGGRPR